MLGFVCVHLTTVSTLVLKAFVTLSFANVRFLQLKQTETWTGVSVSGFVPPVLQMLSSSLMSQIWWEGDTKEEDIKDWNKHFTRKSLWCPENLAPCLIPSVFSCMSQPSVEFTQWDVVEQRTLKVPCGFLLQTNKSCVYAQCCSFPSSYTAALLCTLPPPTANQWNGAKLAPGRSECVFVRNANKVETNSRIHRVCLRHLVKLLFKRMNIKSCLMPLSDM